MREGFVAIFHPDLDEGSNTGEVPEATLSIHRDAGWQLLTEDGPADIAADPASVDPEYDPSVYTVAQVLEYIDSLDVAGREAVIAAENDGKARAGILAAPTSPPEDPPTTSEEAE